VAPATEAATKAKSVAKGRAIVKKKVVTVPKPAAKKSAAPRPKKK
jgi:hypothetical protein